MAAHENAAVARHTDAVLLDRLLHETRAAGPRRACVWVGDTRFGVGVWCLGGMLAFAFASVFAIAFVFCVSVMCMVLVFVWVVRP